ncbi:MAG TPA: DoxX family protein, partial [Pyrinomonadaceae bacterium]|nr:DoxX family protein [Pyrinomonadaceae bacterium]
MEAISHAPIVSSGRMWTGRIMSWLVALFLIADAVMKLVKPAFVVDANTQLGYRESVIIPIGVVLLVSAVLYLIPQTAVLGAILLTGYLGGAVATHVRADGGVFPIVFAIVFGVLV